MEILRIREPQSGQIREFSITPKMHEGKQAWCLSLEDGREELIGLDEHDVWMQLAGNNIDPRLVTEIGKAIEERASGHRT